MKKTGIIMFAGLLAAALAASPVWAREKEICVFFTGQARAELYPCLCPREPDGGVARRATVLRKARAEHPGLLVVEAGASFASGAQDQNKQNFEVDVIRTEVYLDALKAMGYDALLLSGQEFVFGASFLKRLGGAYPFVSSNVKAYGCPHIVKDVNGVRVAVLGLTDSTAAAKEAIAWQAPFRALADEVRGVREQGAEVVVLLSSLTPEEDAVLLKSVPGVDVVINGAESYGSVKASEVGGAVCVSTWWQARKAGLLRLRVAGGKVSLLGLDTLSLDPGVADDAAVAALLPSCLKDADCAPRAGLVARCTQEGGPREASCVYIDPPPLDVTVIVPKESLSCRQLPFLTGLQQVFAKVRPRMLDPDEPEARRIIDALGVTAAPVYVFEEKVEGHPLFVSLSQLTEKKGGIYWVKPAAAGVCAFLSRPRVPGRLDVFMDLFYPDLPELVRRLREMRAQHKDLDVRLHFLATEDPEGGFVARGGTAAVEEFKRLACAEALSADKMFDYLACRADAKDSGWWEACAREAGIDAGQLQRCAAGPEGERALRAKTALTNELDIALGPTLLVGNRDVYFVVKVPSLEELEEILKPGQATDENK